MPEVTAKLDVVVDHQTNQAAPSLQNEKDRTYTAIIYDWDAPVYIIGPFGRYYHKKSISTNSHTKNTRGSGSQK